MKKLYVLAVAAVFAALLVGAPLLAQQNTTAGFGAEMFDIICSSLPTAVTSRFGIEPTGDGHSSSAGIYMPMFSTPPKGGIPYNGPPLDDC
jgi:predicted small secreted protein